MAFPSVAECVAAADRIAPAMLSAAAGGVVVLGVAGLAAAAMRRASASARHEVWALGLAGVLVLPVLSATLPGWHVLPIPGRNRPAPPLAGAVAAAPSPASARLTAAAEVTPDSGAIASADGALNAGSPQVEATAPPAPAERSPSAPPATVPLPTPSGRSERLPWTAWLLVCWASGSLLMLCRVALGHLSLWSLRRRCVPVTGGEWFDLLGRLREELGLRRRVELLRSPVRAVPMTWGLWRARLLVPGHADSWPPGQRRDVLLHELGHVRRRDCLTQLLPQLACALYWFNPLAWVANRRMQVERERACDDLVLNRGAEPTAYAGHLLASVASVPSLRLAGAIAMARPSTLEERMNAILNTRLNRGGLSVRGSLPMVLLLLAALVPVATLRGQDDPVVQDPPADRGPNRSARSADDRPPAPPAAPPATDPNTRRPPVAGPRPGGRAGFGGPPVPVLGKGPTCTLDATVYEVRLPADQTGRLDVDALAKASQTAESFEKALAALGATRPMYRANQSVRLSGDAISIGSQVPVVTRSQLTDKGQTISSVQYQNTGAIFTVAGKSEAAGVELDLGIEVSAAGDGVAVGDKANAPVMRRAILSHKGPVEPRKPFVVLGVDAGSPDKDGKAVAYIARVTLGEPREPAAN